MQKTVTFLIAIFVAAVSSAQSTQTIYLNYIAKHAPIAIEQQQKYGIPASITLAQGLLESAAGQSELANASNNHFGIKCHNTWDGDKVYQKDDNITSDCFRKYNSVKDSYEDHSLFLTSRAHYASLFYLSPTDYKGWANGLKKAGYATDPTYANKLIKLIEDYNLHQYDLTDNQKLITGNKTVEVPKTTSAQKKLNPTSSTTLKGHDLFVNNGVKCVFSLPGDTYASIAHEFNINVGKLLRYNDLNMQQELPDGTVVYLKAKKNKASKEFTRHEVKEGENLYRISQKYAIKLQKLYDLNKLPYTAGASVGMVLKLK